MAATLAINGRFLSQPATGVQRFATELLVALDELLENEITDAAAGASFQVLCPTLPQDPPRLRRFVIRRTGVFSGHLWEQTTLPFAQALVLNLANTGPLLRRRQIVAIHDASVYAVPEAYTAAFRLWYRAIYAVAGRNAARVITVSQFSKRELVQQAGLLADRIAVVQEGCDHIVRAEPDAAVIERHGLRRGGYALAVGSRSPHKNLAVVTRAMEGLARRELDLVVVGDTAPRVFAGTGALPPWVKSVGRVSDAALRALYEHAVCLVFPSRYEGFGLPPLEAMACGCPVVASNAAALPETCGDAALYCNPESPEEFARAIERVLSDPPQRSELRRRGLAWARQFTWARCAKQVWHEVGSALRSVSGTRAEPCTSRDPRP